jgi:predicted ribosomally synthesized peptide with SipW-like signal peptide
MVSRSGKILAAAVPLGMLASGALIWQASYAAFSSTTTNPNNTFSAGTVTLTDSRQGPPASVMFTPTGLKPGSTGTSCIKVTYNGSLAANVKLYVAPSDLTTSSSTNLAQYLTVQVAEGSGSANDCSDFTGGTNIYNATGQGDLTKTLSAFSTASGNFATGVSSFAPTGSGQTKTYKITYWLQDNSAAAGMNSTAKFTWEAQNT